MDDTDPFMLANMEPAGSFYGLEGTFGDAANDYAQPTNAQTPGAFSPSVISQLLNTLGKAGTSAANFAASPQGLASLGTALAAYQTRAQPSGGGTTLGYGGYQPLTRRIVQGPYGPIAEYGTASSAPAYVPPAGAPSPAPAPSVAPAPAAETPMRLVTQPTTDQPYVYQPTISEMERYPAEMYMPREAIDPTRFTFDKVDANQDIYFVDPKYTFYQFTLPSMRMLGSDVTQRIVDAAKTGNPKEVLSGLTPAQMESAVNIIDYLQSTVPPANPMYTTYSRARDIARAQYQDVLGNRGYATGGKVQMEDGGFVLTKRAVDGAGGPQGITQLVPGARMIRGPGNGTSDSIPAEIRGLRGIVPAKVSNGEAYVPRAEVQKAGGAPAMYALMNSLQRKA